MEPSTYVPAYLEREYLAAHPELTPAARDLVHTDVVQRPDRYVTTDHARALVAYARTHRHLFDELDRIDDLPDEEFDRKRTQLFDETRLAMFKIAEADRLVVDAHLVGTLLTDTGLDACISDIMKVEARAREHLEATLDGFDMDAPHFITEDVLARENTDAAAITVAEPSLIGWLHAIEVISQLSLASARYRAAASYARLVMRAAGYPNHAEGTVLITLARLEDEDGFFAFARELSGEGAQTQAARDRVDDSPWFLLSRTLLLYKLGKERAARRALRDFSERCDGGAFFLLNPTYITPYLPVRPPVAERWRLTHQAVWEAEGVVYDTPDFVPWAESVSGIFDASEHFADLHGF